MDGVLLVLGVKLLGCRRGDGRRLELSWYFGVEVQAVPGESRFHVHAVDA